MRVFVIYGLICIAAVILLGVFSVNPWYAMSIALLLVVLELSLSFDNAVINARVLRKMSPEWQRRFLTWGILIAVFGVRLVLPFLLVYWGSDLPLHRVLTVALHDPDGYRRALEHAFPYIAAFGSGFLLMVWLMFMHEKKVHLWLPLIERWGFWRSYWLIGLIMAVIGVIFGALAHHWVYTLVFLIAALLQFALHSLSHYLSARLNAIGKLGLAGFIYLEFLDASFSLDGVVGAFAITSDIATIMIGLGCGALVMRAMTIYCVKKEIAQKFVYLEHGAHYALLCLASILLLKVFIHVPEWITGSVAVVIIAISVMCSFGHCERTQ